MLTLCRGRIPDLVPQDGIERITVTDNSLTGGAPGIIRSPERRQLADDWARDKPAIKYSVGGTVSGLSGSLVLQDNAGDDLSVGRQGSFTFARPRWLDGTAYSVTVKTQAGRSDCTISNANGTIASATVTNVAVTCGVDSGRRRAPMISVGRMVAVWGPVGRQ